jgi:NAD(P)-dependent dehydrogenase (short-subunit alcohol dehydrogenase family)
METDFKDKIVVITAGASGIGYNIASGFSNRGANVFVCDVDAAKVKIVNNEDNGIKAFVANVSKAEEVDNFFNFIKSSHKHIDIMINNAGIAGPTARVEDIKPAEWEQTVAVTLNGMFFNTRLAVPMIRKANGGSIINISSSAAYFGFPYRTPYAASKWGIIGFTKTIAMELGPEGIRVNAICPGSVSGERIDSVIQREADLRGLKFEDIKASYERQVSLRTFVDAEDVTNTILFLCSEYGAKISGQALGVDGHTETLTNY